MTFYPGREDGNYPYGSTTVKSYAVLPEYKSSESRDYDWAVLVLNSNIGDVAGTLTFGKYNDYNNCIGRGAVISGYPVGYQHYQYGANGYINSSTDFVMEYTIDTTGGQSGSPIMDADKRAFGVHTGGSEALGTNWGSRVNDRFYEVAQYACENY